MTSSSNSSVVDSITDDFLTCHICFEIFTDPRILPCLHTYCFRCICSHVESAQADGRPCVCPECREPIMGAISSPQKNFFIKSLIEVVQMKTDTSLSCTACHLKGSKSPAKVKCLDCGDYLCSTCSDGHNASSQTWTHEKISLGDIKEGTYDEKLRQLQKIKCLKHEDKDVEYYCQSCTQPVCISCILVSHRDHTCQTLSDATTHRRASIISLTQSIRQNISNLKRKELTLLSALDSTKRKRDQEILVIEKTTKTEIDRLVAKKETEIKQLMSKSLLEEKKQESELEEVQLQKAVVNSCLNFCDNILEKGRDEEILMLEKMITERPGQLQGEPDETCNEPDLTELMYIDATEPDLEDRKHFAQNEDKSNKTNETFESDSVTEMIEKVKTLYSATASSQDQSQRPEMKLSWMFMAQHQSDSTIPDIKGFAYSKHIGLVLSDNANKSLKIFSTEGVIKKVFSTDSFSPHAVAIAGDVIGVISENFLFLSMHTGEFVNTILIHKYKPNPCLLFNYALMATKDEFIVGNIPDEYRLRVYGVDGTLKQLISCQVQLPLKSLSLTHGGDIVICEWGTACVKIISWQCILKTICQRTPNWKPNDACVSKKNIIYVADYDLGEICVFDTSGKLLLLCSTAPEGVKPVGLLLDEQEQLYVAGRNGYVSVYNTEST